MGLTPLPSKATTARWDRGAYHLIRIEIALLFISVMGTLLGVPIGVASNEFGPGPASLWGRIFFHCDLFLVTFFLAWIHLGVIANHSMHPVYALCMDITMILLAAIVLWTWLSWDVEPSSALYGDYWYSGSSDPGIAYAGLVRSVLGGVQGFLYFLSMCFAARAVHNHRKGRKSSSVRHIEDTAADAPMDFDQRSLYTRQSQYTTVPPPTYYTGSNIYAPSAFGTSVSSRPATIFSDLTTVKGDHLSTISEKPMDGEKVVEDEGMSLKSL